MADIINDPSKSYHPLNNYNINNPNGVVKDNAGAGQCLDVFPNLSMFWEIAIIVAIVAVSTLIMIYVIKKFSF